MSGPYDGKVMSIEMDWSKTNIEELRKKWQDFWTGPGDELTYMVVTNMEKRMIELEKENALLRLTLKQISELATGK